MISVVTFFSIELIQLIFVNGCSKGTESNDTAPIDSGGGNGANNVNNTKIPNPNPPGPNAPGPNTPGAKPNGPISYGNGKSEDYWPGAIGDCSGLNGTAHFNGTARWNGIKGPNNEVYSCFNDQYLLVEQTSHPTHQYETNTYKVNVLSSKFGCVDVSNGGQVGEVAGSATFKEFFKSGDTFTCVASIPFLKLRNLNCNGTVTGVCMRLWCPSNQVATKGGHARYVRMEKIPGEFEHAPETFDEDANKLGFTFGGPGLANEQFPPGDRPDCAWMYGPSERNWN